MTLKPLFALGCVLSLGAAALEPASAGDARLPPAAYAAAGAERPVDAGTLTGRWRVLRLNGARIPTGTLVTIDFGPDGRASGQGGCNSFTSTYTLTPDGLTFSQPAATMRACAAARMKVEGQFFQALPSVTSAARGQRGSLRLMAGNRTVLVLRRG